MPNKVKLSLTVCKTKSLILTYHLLKEIIIDDCWTDLLTVILPTYTVN